MIVRGILKAREVKRLYNHSLTRKENLRILKENGVRISDRTLRRMVSREEIKLISKKPNHTYLSCCPDSDTILILRLIDKNGDIKQSEIASAMNVSLPTVKRYMKAMKGVLIERDGNNRSGRWVVLPHVRKELDKQNVLKIPMEEKQPFISQREACNG